MKIIKRDGAEVNFDVSKIYNAIMAANADVPPLHQIDSTVAWEFAHEIEEKCKHNLKTPKVEEVQDEVEYALMEGYPVLAKAYITYRYEHNLLRKQNTTDAQILTTVNLQNEEVLQENSNKDPAIIPTQRDYIAGLVSRDLTDRYFLPEDIKKAHEAGIIHFHDSDYFIQRSHNCCLVNLEDMLQNGTVINKTLIEKPHSFATACNIATQIMAQVASCQYGGQTITLSHLAPFVDISRQKIAKEVEKELWDIHEKIDLNSFYELVSEITEARIRDEIRRGVQTMQYQINTLMTTNGQTPFVSIFMYLGEAKNDLERADLALIIEEVLNQRLQGVKNEQGIWVTPAFPKLLYVLEEDNVSPESKYYYLTELAAKCTAKRMVPDYISEKKMRKFKINANGTGDCYACMGCRSFLTPDRTIHTLGNVAKALNYTPNEPKYWGRFNQGVVTINLVDIACSSQKDMTEFWKIFDERLELCHRALRIRHEHLLSTPSDVAPILWQYGALARLDKGETIDKLLYGGYSTISLGYAGLWECVYYMTGKKLTEEEGKQFGLKVMQKLNDYTAKWKAAEDIDYSLYGTPIESTTYKFARCLQDRFGIIEGVTDKNYITNSYHIHVTEPIDAFSKLKLEADFQKLSPGGAISYVEVPNMQNNIPAVLAVIKYIYDNIMYAELNTKSDYCMVCGYDGEIKIVEKENKLYWECPHCGNRDQSRMSVVRRTCGYLGSNYWNQGRTAEIRDRVLHL